MSPCIHAILSQFRRAKNSQDYLMLHAVPAGRHQPDRVADLMAKGEKKGRRQGKRTRHTLGKTSPKVARMGGEIRQLCGEVFQPGYQNMDYFSFDL